MSRPNYYRVKVMVRPVGDNSQRAQDEVELECQDLIEALGSDFNIGNMLKYLFRAGRKTESRVEDLMKVKQYAEFALAQAIREEDDQ